MSVNRNNIELNEVLEMVKSLSDNRSRLLIEEKDITFIDYDGTLVASYTIEEAHKLRALPKPPEHTGLKFQGWNWTLDEIKQWNSFAYIGAHYATIDGNTKIYITLDDPDYLSPTLNFHQTNAHGVIIDWGDGSDPETSDIVRDDNNLDSSYVRINHTYESMGDYIITLRCDNGTFSFYGVHTNNYTSDILTLNEQVEFGNSIYYNTITKLEIGETCTGLTSRSANLKICNIPKDVTHIYPLNCNTICISKLVTCFIPAHSFEYMSNVVNISVPYIFNPVEFSMPRLYRRLRRFSLYNTNISESIYTTGTQIERLYIHDSATEISRCDISDYLKEVSGCKNITRLPSLAFDSCSSLEYITIPEGIKIITKNCFAYTNIREFIIPESITDLYEGCFISTKLNKIVIPKNVTTVGFLSFGDICELCYVKVESPVISFDESAFSCINMSAKRYYDFTKATVTDGILSYVFGTTVFDGIEEGTIIMFATKEIADVAKESPNLTMYADYIHYLGEGDITE